MRRFLLVTAALAAAPAALVSSPRRAQACGGCFAPPDTITAVDSHRMVVALSTERTTLWDQIRYSGAPEDFVWVLPVPRAVPDLEVADPAFFDQLDQGTAPIVIPPPVPPPLTPCPPSAGGGGIQDAAPGPAIDGGVDVIAEETVGPYETVTVASDDPQALHTWLTDHGYAVPAVTLPAISYYVSKGSAFVVMRLAPDVGVDAMTPIRVRYIGYMSTFPLRMVTVGASGELALSLWVIAEQRYEALNYGNGRILGEDLTWSWNTFSHDYAQVFRERVDALGGAGWITEFAAPLAWVGLGTPDEVAIASHGLAAPYVTRLRTTVLVDNIGADLELGPALDPGLVGRELQITTAVGDPPSLCPGGGGPGGGDGNADDDDESPWFPTGCAVGGRGAGGVVAMSGLLLALIAIRRRRTR